MNIYGMKEHNTILGQKCDVCGIDNLVDYGKVPITINFGYGSSLDEEEYHFCSEGHAIQFLADELRKKETK